MRHCCVTAEKEIRRCYEENVEAKIHVRDGAPLCISHVTEYLQEVVTELVRELESPPITGES
jgi:hypothetical protein